MALPILPTNYRPYSPLRNAASYVPEYTEEMAAADQLASQQTGYSDFEKGMTSGFSGANAGVNAFLAATGGNLGFENFAKNRLRQANEQVAYANAMAPGIENTGQIEGGGDLSRYIAGKAGGAVGILPYMLGGGALGGAKYGQALAAGSFMPMTAGGILLNHQDTMNEPGTYGPALGAGIAAGLIGGVPIQSAIGRGALADLTTAGLRGVRNPLKAAAGRFAATTAAGGAIMPAIEGAVQMAESSINPKRDTSGDPEARRQAMFAGLAGMTPFAASHALTGGAGGLGRGALNLGKKGLDAAKDMLPDEPKSEIEASFEKIDKTISENAKDYKKLSDAGWTKPEIAKQATLDALDAGATKVSEFLEYSGAKIEGLFDKISTSSTLKEQLIAIGGGHKDGEPPSGREAIARALKDRNTYDDVSELLRQQYGDLLSPLELRTKYKDDFEKGAITKLVKAVKSIVKPNEPAEAFNSPPGKFSKVPPSKDAIKAADRDAMLTLLAAAGPAHRTELLAEWRQKYGELIGPTTKELNEHIHKATDKAQVARAFDKLFGEMEDNGGIRHPSENPPEPIFYKVIKHVDPKTGKITYPKIRDRERVYNTGMSPSDLARHESLQGLAQLVLPEYSKPAPHNGKTDFRPNWNNPSVKMLDNQLSKALYSHLPKHYKNETKRAIVDYLRELARAMLQGETRKEDWDRVYEALDDVAPKTSSEIKRLMTKFANEVRNPNHQIAHEQTNKIAMNEGEIPVPAKDRPWQALLDMIRNAPKTGDKSLDKFNQDYADKHDKSKELNHIISWYKDMRSGDKPLSKYHPEYLKIIKDHNEGDQTTITSMDGERIDTNQKLDATYQMLRESALQDRLEELFGSRENAEKAQDLLDTYLNKEEYGRALEDEYDAEGNPIDSSTAMTDAVDTDSIPLSLHPHYSGKSKTGHFNSPLHNAVEKQSLLYSQGHTSHMNLFDWGIRNPKELKAKIDGILLEEKIGNENHFEKLKELGIGKDKAKEILHDTHVAGFAAWKNKQEFDERGFIRTAVERALPKDAGQIRARRDAAQLLLDKLWEQVHVSFRAKTDNDDNRFARVFPFGWAKTEPKDQGLPERLTDKDLADATVLEGEGEHDPSKGLLKYNAADGPHVMDVPAMLEKIVRGDMTPDSLKYGLSDLIAFMKDQSISVDQRTPLPRESLEALGIGGEIDPHLLVSKTGLTAGDVLGVDKFAMTPAELQPFVGKKEDKREPFELAQLGIIKNDGGATFDMKGAMREAIKKAGVKHPHMDTWAGIARQVFRDMADVGFKRPTFASDQMRNVVLGKTRWGKDVTVGQLKEYSGMGGEKSTSRDFDEVSNRYKRVSDYLNLLKDIQNEIVNNSLGTNSKIGKGTGDYAGIANKQNDALARLESFRRESVTLAKRGNTIEGGLTAGEAALKAEADKQIEEIKAELKELKTKKDRDVQRNAFPKNATFSDYTKKFVDEQSVKTLMEDARDALGDNKEYKFPDTPDALEATIRSLDEMRDDLKGQTEFDSGAYAPDPYHTSIGEQMGNKPLEFGPDGAPLDYRPREPSVEFSGSPEQIAEKAPPSIRARETSAAAKAAVEKAKNHVIQLETSLRFAEEDASPKEISKGKRALQKEVREAKTKRDLANTSMREVSPAAEVAKANAAFVKAEAYLRIAREANAAEEVINQREVSFKNARKAAAAAQMGGGNEANAALVEAKKVLNQRELSLTKAQDAVANLEGERKAKVADITKAIEGARAKLKEAQAEDQASRGAAKEEAERDTTVDTAGISKYLRNINQDDALRFIADEKTPRAELKKLREVAASMGTNWTKRLVKVVDERLAAKNKTAKVEAATEAKTPSWRDDINSAGNIFLKSSAEELTKYIETASYDQLDAMRKQLEDWNRMPSGKLGPGTPKSRNVLRLIDRAERGGKDLEPWGSVKEENSELTAAEQTQQTEEGLPLAEQESETPLLFDPDGKFSKVKPGGSFSKNTPKGSFYARDLPERLEHQEKTDSFLKRLFGGILDVEFADMKDFSEHVVKNPETGRWLMKISMFAMNPQMGGSHGAMHIMFKEMAASGEKGRHVVDTLVRATSHEQVVKRMEDYFKDLNEKFKKQDKLRGTRSAWTDEELNNVLEQLKDPEERAAYAYELYRAGALKLSPVAHGAINKIAAAIRRFLNWVGLKHTTDAERAEKWMDWTEDANFTKDLMNPSVLARALGETKVDQIRDNIVNSLKPYAKAVQNVFSSAPERLIRTGDKRLMALSELYTSQLIKPDGEFIPKELEGKQGFAPARDTQGRLWSTKWNNTFGGEKHTREELDAALDEVQRGKATTPLAKKIRAFFNEFIEYQIGAGLAKSHLADIPQHYDIKRIVENWEEFEKDVELYGGFTNKTKARATADSIRKIVEDNGLMQNDFLRRGELPTFMFKDADIAAKWMLKDTNSYVQRMLRSGVSRAEQARIFGPNNQVMGDIVTSADLPESLMLDEHRTLMRDFVAGIEGWKGENMNPSIRKAQAAMITAMNVAVLPFSIFAAQADPLYIAARANDPEVAFTAMGKGLQSIGQSLLNKGGKLTGEGVRFAEDLGLIEQAMLTDAAGDFYSGLKHDGFLKKTNDIFFRWNLLTGWDRMMIATAAMAGKQFISKSVLYPKSDELATRQLKELGLTKADVFHTKDGQLKVFEADGLTPEQSEKMRNAIAAFVNEAAVRPNASTNAIWMNDPHFGLISHLKRFTFAQSKNVIGYANREAAQGNKTPWALLSITVFFMMGINAMRNILTGGHSAPTSFFGSLMKGMASAGVGGKYGDTAYHAYNNVQFGGTGVEVVAGPEVEMALQTARNLGGGAAQ